MTGLPSGLDLVLFDNTEYEPRSRAEWVRIGSLNTPALSISARALWLRPPEEKDTKTGSTHGSRRNSATGKRATTPRPVQPDTPKSNQHDSPRSATKFRQKAESPGPRDARSEISAAKSNAPRSVAEYRSCIVVEWKQEGNLLGLVWSPATANSAPVWVHRMHVMFEVNPCSLALVSLSRPSCLFSMCEHAQ